MAKQPLPDRPGLDDGPLRWEHLTRGEQTTAGAMMSDLSENTTSNAAHVAHTLRNATHTTAVSQRRRMTSLAEEGKDRKLSMGQAVDRRVSAVLDAATTHRLPHEGLAGAGWYYEHNRGVQEAIAGTDTDFDAATSAASRLSPKNTPENEKATLTGLAHAHQHGAVHMDEHLAGALASLPGKDRYDVPPEQIGKVVAFRDLPGHAVMSMAHPDIRETVRSRVSNVDIDQISRTSMRGNIGIAHDVMTNPESAQHPDPHKNPKLYGYALGHRMAVPGTPEHGEYMSRMLHIGESARGETHGEGWHQDMLDLYGLRHSEEGMLNPHAPTAQDTWMNAITMGQKSSQFKAAGDLYLTRKVRGEQVKDDAGNVVSDNREYVGKGDTRVTAMGIHHAWNQEATERAGRKLRDQLDLDFEVPAVGVQETSWTAARRAHNEDPDYNRQVRESANPNVGRQMTGQQSLNLNRKR